MDIPSIGLGAKALGKKTGRTKAAPKDLPADSFVSSATPEEEKQLEEYITRHREGSGLVLNPPGEEMKPQVKRLHGYLHDMVDRLAGERLNEEGVHLRISLYSSDEINAFMGRHDRGKGDPQGKLEEPDEHQTEPWAVRKFAGIAQDGKPMYELGWNVGNFQKLKHEEEVAFVVAHELSHLFENHLDPEERLHRPGDAWLSSQSHEAVADHQAVKMMAKAGYNTEAVLVTLTRLFTGHEEGPSMDDLVEGLSSGAAAHHHEGVRIALAQGQLEMLRREDPTVRPGGALTPLPKELLVAPKFEDTYRVKEIAGLQESVDTLLVDHLLKPEPLPWLTRESYSMEEAPPQVEIISESELSAKELGGVTVAALDALEKAQASPQRKVDAFLRFSRLSEALTSYGQGIELSEQQEEKLTGFLLRNSFAWKSEEFLKLLDGDSDPEGDKFLRQGFANNVILEKGLEGTWAKLHAANSQWAQLLDQTPDMLLTNAESGEKNDIGWLTDQIGMVAEHPDGAMAKIHQQNFRLALRDMDFDEQVEAVGDDKFDKGGMKFRHTLSRMLDPNLEKKAKDKAFLAEVKQTLQPTLKKFGEFRDRYLLETLRGEGEAKDDPGITQTVLWDGFSSLDQVPFSAETQEQMPAALMAYLRRANEQENFLDDGRGMGARLFDVNENFGKHLTALLDEPKSSPEEKKQILQYIMGSLSVDESLSRDEEKAAMLGPLARHVRTLTTEQVVSHVLTPRHQNEGALSKAITAIYGVEKPDLSPEGMASLIEQRHAGKLKRPKGDDTLRLSSQTIPHIANKELNSQLSVMSLVGADKELSQRLASKVTAKQLDQMLEATEKAFKRNEQINAIGIGMNKEGVSSDASLFLMDALLANPQGKDKAAEWFGQADRILDLNPMALDGRAEYRERFEEKLLPLLQAMKTDQLTEWLGKEHILSILKPENTATLVTKIVGSKGTPAELAERVKSVDEQLALSEEYPEAHNLFTEELAKKAKLQPNDIDVVFPPDERTFTEKADGLSGHIRGLSALVGLSRDRSAEEQIHLLEYLMGREADEPEFLQDAVDKLEQKVPIGEVLRHTRSRLQKEESAVRVMVVNSFLAGPTSFIKKPGGLDKLLDHLLADISPKHQKMARRLAEALLDSQGSTDSLALAYVMGQRSDRADGKMDEATVLSNLFDAYGVPGIKFKQYLAFTSEFAEFRDAFESAQDSAMPLSYLDAVRLVDERFDGKWPEGLKIDKVLGSGSVNVAIRYFNPETKEKEVLSIAREDIESATDYDFYRFNKFLKSLTNTPEDKKQFGYLLGLSDVIKESVGLEMDKQAAMEMQQSVQPLYNQKVNGWNIKSIPAFKQENMAIFMAEAKGETARRLQKADPEAYESAMKALSQVEFDALLGIDQNRGSAPVPLHANPDFHDGQVLIDPETKSVTILDFGQAVPISNKDRELAVDLLGMIGKAESLKDSLEILNTRTGLKTPVESEELEEIMEREDAMDTFVHLLSLVGRKGGRVPISAVHWVMGVHRQMALGEKIGQSNDKMVRNLTVVRQLGGSLQTYNRLHIFKQRVQAAGKHVLNALGFGAAAHSLSS